MIQITIYDLRLTNAAARKQLRQIVIRPRLLSGSIVIFLFLTIACAAQKKGGKAYYHEELHALRPKYTDVIDSPMQNKLRVKNEVLASRNVNAKVDAVLDSIKRFNVTRKFIDGYTLQIYTGQNREDAMNAKKKMQIDASDMNAELEYNQPKFRVRVGSYLSRLEAQKDLVRLKRLFPNAILVPEKIQVR